ncbi:hypothetical protein [Comamonas sp. F1-6]|jgi:hypothetical protein|uniref:hypothetical protein n=1 Tax=Comamonas sp. F1-6 TaxID=673550 RepID=UPI0031CE9C58
MFVVVLMMNVREMLMSVSHGLMSVQMRVLAGCRQPILMDMLMMLIMFVFMAMFQQPMGVLVLMGLNKVYHRRSLVETKMHCVKRLDERVMSRTFEREAGGCRRWPLLTIISIFDDWPACTDHRQETT